MEFVRFLHGSAEIWVIPQKVAFVQQWGHGSKIGFDGGQILQVNESPSKVIKELLPR